MNSKLAVLLLGATSVGASHFRYGSINWHQAEGNTVNFDVTTAWTRDYGNAFSNGNVQNVNFEYKGTCEFSEEKGVLKAAKRNADVETGSHRIGSTKFVPEVGVNIDFDQAHLPQVGDLIVVNDLTGMPRLHFGDGEWTYLEVCVTATSVEENWFFGHSSASHTYTYPTDYHEDQSRDCDWSDGTSDGVCDPWTGGPAIPWEVTYTGCCKFGNDNLEQAWDFGADNQNDWPRPGGAVEYNRRGEVNNLNDGEPERDWDKAYGYNLPETRKPWRLVSQVNLLHESASPAVVTLPVVSVVSGAESCFYLGSVDEHMVTGGEYRAGNDYEYGANTDFYQTDGSSWTNLVDHTPITSKPWESLTVQGNGNVCVDATGLSQGLYNAVVIISNGKQAAREEWSEQDNQFSQLTTGATTPVDFLVRVLDETDNSVPTQEWGELTGIYPEINTEYTGFWHQDTIHGADAQTDQRISFTTINTPEFCGWSTVSGVNPAHMTLECLACSEDVGMHILCTESVDDYKTDSSGSNAYTSTQHCLAKSVHEDPAPQLDAYAGGNDENILVIGRTHSFDVAGSDENPHDSVTVTAENLPEGATFDGTTFTWTPAHDQGGMTAEVDFVATDQADMCGNAATTTTVTRTLHVRTCVYDVQSEQQLQEIAEIFQTDWMTVWSLNPCNHEDGSFCHPDYFLSPGTTINVGHFKRIEAHDNLYDLAERFGTSVDNINTMNHGMDANALQLGDAICIVPNACDGASNAHGPNGGI